MNAPVLPDKIHINFTQISNSDALYFTALYYNILRKGTCFPLKGDETLMRRLWQLTKNRCKNRQNAYRIFISISTFSWTVPPFFVVLAGCVLLQVPMLQALSIALTTAGVTGTAIGFFGGLLYLMRTE